MVAEKLLFYNFKTMADRFPNCDAKELQQFKESAENSNTKKSTETWDTVWTTWADEKGCSPVIVSYEAKELDKKLQKFFAEVREKGGSDYEPYSLRVMIASLDRHLKAAGSSISIAKDREFVNSRKVLEGKARFLREQGYGKRSHASKALTTEDEEIFWSKGLLGSQSPKSLIVTMWGFFDTAFRITRLPGAPRHVCRTVFIQQRRQWRRVYHLRRKIPQKGVRAAFAK